MARTDDIIPTYLPATFTRPKVNLVTTKEVHIFNNEHSQTQNKCKTSRPVSRSHVFTIDIKFKYLHTRVKTYITWYLRVTLKYSIDCVRNQDPCTILYFTYHSTIKYVHYHQPILQKDCLIIIIHIQMYIKIVDMNASNKLIIKWITYIFVSYVKPNITEAIPILLIIFCVKVSNCIDKNKRIFRVYIDFTLHDVSMA